MKTQSNSHLLRIEEVRPWLSVDRTGEAHVFEAGVRDIMRRTDSTLYDVRRIHSNNLFSFPSIYSPVLGRGRAIIVNVEPIQVFITADEVILRDPSSDTPFVQGLQARIRSCDTTTTPFELVVLEACLEAACSVLENEAKMLEQEAHTLSLYKLMSRLVDITDRVQILKEGLGSFLFDESNMDTYSTANDKFVVKELKMLLEAYYFQILSILNKLSKMRKYFDHTEDKKLKHREQFVATLFTAILVLLACTVVTSIFRLYIASYDPRLFGTKAYFCYVGGCIARVIFLYVVAIAWWNQKRKLE